ncbi:hypothetical protein A2387_02625 [Candidatus Nomurabacteria bacterium RIFOXYB1_FULL_36_10]|nr:MAG: hypothetical protein A2387_02625 [Candidatus Nomurabacteria bacterium RIFOXYB1_FULL_36_10]
MKRINMDPNVPISKPLPKSDTYREEEKKDDIKNISGIAPAKRINLSFGTVNLPSPSRAINQKKTERVVPTESRNPLLASSVTGT